MKLKLSIHELTYISGKRAWQVAFQMDFSGGSFRCARAAPPKNFHLLCSHGAPSPCRARRPG